MTNIGNFKEMADNGLVTVTGLWGGVIVKDWEDGIAFNNNGHSVEVILEGDNGNISVLGGYGSHGTL